MHVLSEGLSGVSPCCLLSGGLDEWLLQHHEGHDHRPRAIRDPDSAEWSAKWSPWLARATEREEPQVELWTLVRWVASRSGWPRPSAPRYRRPAQNFRPRMAVGWSRGEDFPLAEMTGLSTRKMVFQRFSRMCGGAGMPYGPSEAWGSFASSVQDAGFRRMSGRRLGRASPYRPAVRTAGCTGDAAGYRGGRCPASVSTARPDVHSTVPSG